MKTTKLLLTATIVCLLCWPVIAQTPHSIYDLNYPASGGTCYDGPYNGTTNVNTWGIITAIAGSAFVLQETEHSTYAGIWCYAGSYDLSGFSVGDSVVVNGDITEYYGLTEVENITSVTLQSSGATVTPLALTAADISPTCDEADEAYENMLVTVSNVTIDSVELYGNYWASDVNDDVFLIDNDLLNPLPVEVGQTYLSITGVHKYAYDANRLQPRDAGDFESSVNLPPVISWIYRDPYPTVYPTDIVTVNATITDYYAVDTAIIYVQTSTALTFSPIALDSIETGTDIYWFTIGTNAIGTLVEYYIEATDEDDATSVSDTGSYTVADPTPPLQTIAEAQFNDSDPGEGNDCYPAADNGNNVTLTGVVCAVKPTPPHRFYMQDADSTWSGMFVYNPSEEVELGDSITANGPITEYYGTTEWNAPTITYHGTGTVFDPVVVTSDDITPACEVPGESYESMLVKLQNALCVVGTSGGQAWLKSDGAADSCLVDDYNYAPLPMPNFVEGLRYNVVGIVGYYSSRFMIYPRNPADIQALAGSPVIENVERHPSGLVYPTDIVTVSADITDDGDVATDSLYIETVAAEYFPVPHDSIVGNTYWYTIGANATGTTVNYYIVASDDEANRTQSDTYSYTVQDPSGCVDDIYSIQFTVVPGTDPDCYPSPRLTETVDVCGVVTGFKAPVPAGSQEAKFFIQNPDGTTWESIYIYDGDYACPDLAIGDLVEIFATVSEYLGLTELIALTGLEILDSNVDLPETSNVTVSDFAPGCSFLTEPYEGMLVKIDNITVDSVDGYNWWISDDGSANAIRLSNYLYYNDPALAPDVPPAVGVEYSSVIGITQWDGDVWSLRPRFGDDFEVSVVPPPVALAVYPIDRDTLAIVFDHDIDGTSLSGASYVLSGGLTASNPRMHGTNPRIVLLDVSMAPADDGKLDSITVSGVEDTDDVPMVEQTLNLRQGFTPISQIQFASAPGDSGWWESDMFGEVVTVRAFVTSDSTAYHRTNLFISDTNTEINGICLYIFDGISHDYFPALGDTVVVTGRVDEYYGESEINTDYGWLYDNMYLVNNGPAPDPLYMGTTTAEYIYNSSLPATEALEGVLCKLCDSLMVIAESNGTVAPYEHFIQSLSTLDTLSMEGQGTHRNYTPPSVGTRIDGMTGVVRWRRSIWRLVPRSEADFNTGYDCGGEVCYEYLPGDVNMYNGSWPPQTIGGDVTYLVNYFRGLSSSQPCRISDGFWCAADVNGDCLVIGSDVTKLVNYFRGTTTLAWCPDRCDPPCWPPVPDDPPSGWPNCQP